MSEINLKILLIGDTSVGKTSILSKYIDDKFDEVHISTIGVEFKVKNLTIKGKKVKLRIWDTSGQERYRSITQNFYRNANGILYIFDLTRKESFENIKDWLIESYNCDSKVKKLLVGNKVDLDKNKQMDKQIIENYAEKKEMKYYEVSAKMGTNINKIFRELAESILSGKSENEMNEEFSENANDNIDRKKDGSFVINRISNKSKKKKSFC